MQTFVNEPVTPEQPPATMRVWEAIGEGSGHPRLRASTRPVPTPSVGELLLRVEACGVCRTDLHVTDGDLPVHREHVVPGHEVVGKVAALGPGTAPGSRSATGWASRGFGASAHLTAQLAIAQGAQVHVFTRGASARRLALQLGALSAGSAADRSPVPLDSAIVFAPAGELVPVALEALDRGGTLSLAGIHMSDVPQMDYHGHLFLEKTVTSVTANTRADGAELLRLATILQIRPQVTPYGFDRAEEALDDLAAGRVTGVAVLGPATGSG